jgi:hypothetical protein
MNRLCARPGCSERATATLAYDYHARIVCLDGLAFEVDPANHDLCTRHADRLSAPQGWELRDLRVTVVEPMFRTARAS